MIGTTLSHYRVVEEIGAGGMGVVYRARDERLDRDVAIKVLPEEVAGDPERLARFEREAKLLASLSHQNIAHLYGLETVEKTVGEGFLTPSRENFLVMELAEGETLAARIERGPVPIEDALDWAKQIAEGLEAAHASGIIHRDLKPANVMLSPEGHIKILDFGLAKAFEPPGSEPSSAESIADSPTLTAGMTRTGTLLGTAAYMSPEQARGKAIDKRTDVWAYGCVVFELLTRRTAFRGEDASQIAAAILRDEPDWDTLPPATPTHIRRLLQRCLAKKPHDRLHDIADARIDVEDVYQRPEPGASTVAVVGASRRRGRWTQVAVIGWFLAVVFGLSTIWPLFRSPIERPQPVARVRLPVPEGEEILWGSKRNAAISPDGSLLVYSGRAEGGHQLWLRPLDRDHALPIPGTEGGGVPFFSPDGEHIAFLDNRNGALKVTSTTGTPPVTLVREAGTAIGDWGSDDMVYFGSVDGGISRIPASGGEPEVVTTPDSERGEQTHSTVSVLPNGKGALLTISHGRGADSEIGLVDLTTKAIRVLGPGLRPLYSGSGHLVWAQDNGVLLAAPFDQDEMKLTGSASSLAERSREFSMSTTGTLVWLPNWVYRGQLVWVDRSGSVQVIDPDWEGGLFFPALSPDGSRVAVSHDGPDGRHIWIKDLPDGVPRQLTFDGSGDQPPVWSPDGDKVIYRSAARNGLVEIDADGMGEASLVLEEQSGRVTKVILQSPWWSRDGRWLVYQRGWYEHADIYAYRPGTGHPPMPLIDTEFTEHCPALSPDGRWLTYVSNRSGRFEVYVKPFPGVAESQWQVSTRGGTDPLWAHNGRELYYTNGDNQLVAVEYLTEPTFRIMGELPLFSVEQFQFFRTNHSFAVSADDQRFVMLRKLESADRHLLLTFNFFTELNRLVPPN